MNPKIIKTSDLTENQTYERCSIAENYSAPDISIARARVKPGETTVAHHLKDVQEIYLIASGQGRVTVGEAAPTEVGEGDVVVLPAGVSQKIANLGKTDLVFYCICTPRFTNSCYFDEESKEKPR
jgi:mannose-6-phosphate isomerase-like protein (cupin superfamily)